jgi:Uma2 family endonuclease
MSAVTLTSGLPPASGPMTVADLDRTPDDGRRYELVDGVLTVSPALLNGHQLVLHTLQVQLESALPAELGLLPGPGLRMSGTTELVPDLAVVPDEELRQPRLTQPPLLVVEVRSPSTALFDMNTKKAVYERFGVPSYWIIVPDPGDPSLYAYELRDGHYEEIAHVTGDQPFEARRPFPVTVIPARLVARLRPRPSR